jgi:hypothetical protein
MAFRFGGVEDGANWASSQTRENLIFGSSECNTHMIRAENIITALLEVDARLAGTNKRFGTLTTSNIFSGSVARMDLNSAGPRFRKGEVIPSWVDKEQYSKFSNPDSQLGSRRKTCVSQCGCVSVYSTNGTWNKLNWCVIDCG